VSAVEHDLPGYEAPKIEDRTAIDTPLIGRGSSPLCAVFNPSN